MANLTIRNLTIDPLEVVSIARFEAERVKTGGVLTSMSNAVSNLLNATDASSTEYHPKGDAHDKRDVSVRIEPFAATETDLRSPDGDREILRLVFKNGDHSYETDVPSPSSRSAVMKKLDDGPHELTVVYVPNGAYLAVYSSASLDSWMKELHDDWPLPCLSIPGTHNSPTCYKALPSVRCQAVGVPEQLQNGVRFMDIRVSASKDDDKLSLVHAVFPISLTGTKYLSDMLNDVYAFLEKNPSETIIMSLKREGTGKASDGDMGRYLKTAYIDKKSDRWYTEPRVPKLGEARGKIVLMRRFGLDDSLKGEHDGQGFGIDAARWPDNCENGEVGTGQIRAQDFYEVTESQNIEKKVDYSRGHLERAAEIDYKLPGMDGYSEDASKDLPPLYVNFLTASNFFNATCWPERIASKVNPAIVEYLCIRHGVDGKGPNSLKVGCAGAGIVVTDWVGAHGDWDLNRCIVGMNARLQLKN
ncbi:hypothetical protein K4F52_005898 [Lecanicillium sp. MT-2017a]|nr:hypothetical protein K4F52_005898 [Lecanicillium sp. MT-2017a]